MRILMWFICIHFVVCMSLYSYSLQIEEHQNGIMQAIEKNRAVIIKGPTGCGKSTFIPYLLRGKRVAIIEPRRIAVVSLFNILSQKIENVGYRMRFNRKCNENTKMTIFTDGSFLNTIQDLDYDYIIVDEVHERSIRTDLILSILKTNFRNKLILMSATLDTAKLQEFFKAHVYEIAGFSYPVDVKYLDSPTCDYITESYLTIKKILKNNEKKDILVFLPGEDDINALYKLCKRIPSISTYKIYSAMNDTDQMKIYEESNLTKVILSTNICETSLTIPNIKYVIDTGLYKVKVFDQISFLGIQAISRDSATQRMGRCNRLGPGVCYRLYTESQKLPVYIPEIMRSDLTTMVLFLINMKRNIFTCKFIDYPPIKNMISALEYLSEKKCITIMYREVQYPSFTALEESFEGKADLVDISSITKNLSLGITNYGRRIVFHPFDTHLAHFYEQCVISNVGYFGSIVASLISQENYNFLAQNVQKPADIEYLVTLFEEYVESEEKAEFCRARNVPIKGMNTAHRVFQTLNHSKQGEIDVFLKVFSRCFSHNRCTRLTDGTYQLHRLDQKLFIHPTSGFFKRKDKEIVVVDVFYTSKPYARIVGKYFEQ